ncbi:hypothetical protein OCU04_004635 [Sclerotinia nivalis]|uniref:Uncharacterized protein n=1 Tax=Sclerotinia nivalis TaxID=352851 RepID=A0A9X0DM55_9HELO|nr:hypothetical protein OCU04_004635 [Sclerotinia nivalis]
MTNAAANKLVQAPLEPFANLNRIAMPPVLQASTPSSGNFQTAMSGLLPPADKEVMYTYNLNLQERGIPLVIRSALGYNNIAETGRLLNVELRYVIGFQGDRFIVKPRNPEVFRENPRIGRQILQDAHAFLVYWHWYIKRHVALPMEIIAKGWLEPGHSTVWKYHDSCLQGQAPKFDMAAHKLVLGYHAADAQKSKKRKM